MVRAECPKALRETEWRCFASACCLEAGGLPLHRVRGEVVLHLEPHPNLDAGPERHGEELGRLGRDGTLAVDDLAHTPERDLEVPGKGILRKPHGLEEVLKQHFAGMRRVLDPAYGVLL